MARDQDKFQAIFMLWLKSTCFFVPQCVLFDVDGLMLDTTRIYDEVNRIVVEGQGKKFDREFHRKLKARDVFGLQLLLLSPF